MVPVEESVKVTVNGLSPLVGVAVKAATGMTAPMPSRELVLLPALLVVNRTTLLKLAALAGVKRTTRLVEPKPGRLKGVPERMVKGPPLTVARPLLRAAPPVLVTVKLVWALVPTATVPKLMLAGRMASWGGVKPMPSTVLVLLPPEVLKKTRLLKLPAVTGLKVTSTEPVFPGSSAKPPSGISKGGVVVMLPVRVTAPVFTNSKNCETV